MRDRSETTVRHARRTVPSPPLARATLRIATLRGIVPAPVWQRLPVSTTFRVDATERSGFLYRAVDDDLIGRALFWRGLTEWEPGTIAPFQRLARRARLLVDVGAKTGVYTLLALAVNPGVRVVAFEPAGRMHERLLENLRINGWTDRCDARADVVGRQAGRVSLPVPPTDRAPSVGLDTGDLGSPPCGLLEVQQTTADAVLAGYDGVDLVKLDGEGLERGAIAGMAATLARCRPALFCACNADEPSVEVAQLLRRFGYRFFQLREGGPVERDQIVAAEQPAEGRYLMLADDKVAWLAAD